MLNQEPKLKMPSRWMVLALALRAIMNLRVLQRQKLYCCLFPLDFEFERDTVFQLWMARGLLQDPSWEHIDINLFGRLLDEEYIYKSRTDILTGISKYRINASKFSALLDRVKSKDRYTLIDDENTGADRYSSWHVSVASKIIDETIFETLQSFTELRTVLLIRDYGPSLTQIPSSFFTALQSMQVLDLSGIHISEVPSSIGYVTDLRFLDLSFTLITRIPESIQFLQELQTLKLRGCKHLHSLPDGIKELLNLYHLDFDILGQLSSMPKGLGTLTKLQTLSSFIVSGENGCSITEIRDMNNLCGSFCLSGLEYVNDVDACEAAMQDKKHITGLHLRWSKNKLYKDEGQLQCSSTLQKLRPHPSLSELKISYFPGSDLAAWIQDPMFENLESIMLQKCGNEKFLHLEWLPNLRHLNVSDMNGVTRIDTWARVYGVRFPKLETLTIDGMLSLQSWTGVEDGDYPCLYKLSVRYCPKLRGLTFLPFLSSLKYLEISYCKSFDSLPDGKLSASLETLVINNCPSLKRRCAKDGEDWEKIEHVSSIWIDMKDIHSSHEDTGSLSEDEDDYSDNSD